MVKVKMPSPCKVKAYLVPETVIVCVPVAGKKLGMSNFAKN
jgi:hypothetical protein